MRHHGSYKMGHRSVLEWVSWQWVTVSDLLPALPQSRELGVGLDLCWVLILIELRKSATVNSSVTLALLSGKTNIVTNSFTILVSVTLDFVAAPDFRERVKVPVTSRLRLS